MTIAVYLWRYCLSMKFKTVCLLLLTFWASITVDAQQITIKPMADQQDLKLAQQYYRSGEYEKALAVFEKLYNNNRSNSYYYQQYLSTLLAIKELDAAKQLIENQITANPKNPAYYVDLGNIYKQRDKDDLAEAEFEKALQRIDEDLNAARKVANAFNKIEEYDYAIGTYEMARAKSNRPDIYLYELATTYNRKGDFDKTVEYYLEYSQYNPRGVQTVKNYFQRYLKTEAQYDVLQKQLYKRIQEFPNELLYPELLIWLFTQKKDFENAIIQVKALDKRFGEDGYRVFNLGKAAVTEAQYEAAKLAFQYVVDKGSGTYYVQAQSQLLRAATLQILSNPTYTNKDIAVLDSNYIAFLNEFGKNAASAETMIAHAELQTKYLYDIDAGISTLNEVIKMPSVKSGVKSQAKLLLGDYYLMQNEVWEAVLIYGQVDKAMKDDMLGEEARYKNAKLSYYIGDFPWAQTQLGVLKAATSELVANNALDLSVFITDHLGLDTTTTTMEMYARADLLFLQNKNDQALATLDSINKIYPGHALTDDILMQRANIALKARNYDAAIEYLNKILEDFSEDILADDATFKLGEIYYYYLEDKEMAMEQFQKVILDYTGSLYTVEARKHYRKLRGDLIN